MTQPTDYVTGIQRLPQIRQVDWGRVGAGIGGRMDRDKQQAQAQAQQQAVMAENKAIHESFRDSPNMTLDERSAMFPNRADEIMKIQQARDNYSGSVHQKRGRTFYNALSSGPEAAERWLNEKETIANKVGDKPLLAQVAEYRKRIETNGYEGVATGVKQDLDFWDPDFAKKLAEAKREGQEGDASELDSKTKSISAISERDKTRAETKKLLAETDLIFKELDTVKEEYDGTVPPEKRPEYELKLRNQYLSETEEFQKVSTAYDRLSSVQNTGAGDLAMIFNFMKMLDPGSVVRESEFATAEATSGLPDSLQNFHKKIISGVRLTPLQRKKFMSQAKDLMKATGPKEKRVRNRIMSQSKGYGLNTKNIFAEDTAREAGATDAPSQSFEESMRAKYSK